MVYTNHAYAIFVFYTYQLENYCLSYEIIWYIPIIPMPSLYLYTYQLENYCLSDEIIRYISIIPMPSLYLYTYQLENYWLSDEILWYIPLFICIPSSWKEYQQNKEWPITSTHWTHKKDHDIRSWESRSWLGACTCMWRGYSHVLVVCRNNTM